MTSSASSYLLDKSALERRRKHPLVRERLDELDDLGLLAICGTIEHELLFSARNHREAELISEGLRWFNRLHMPDEVWDRVTEVQREAIKRGFHRAISMADFLIAATAELHGAIVLHYDGDYDMIASITGQTTEWLVERGTAD